MWWPQVLAWSGDVGGGEDGSPAVGKGGVISSLQTGRHSMCLHQTTLSSDSPQSSLLTTFYNSGQGEQGEGSQGWG